MKSPKLVNGDFVFEHGELVMIEGDEELAQCCEIVLGTNKGEWFLNPKLGIRFERITRKNVTDDAIRQEIVQGLHQEPRIQSVDSVSIVRDEKARSSTVNFNATGMNGEQVSMEVKPGVG